jgi:hypothetical protein
MIIICQLIIVFSDSEEKLLTVVKDYKGPWVQFVEIIEKFFVKVNDLLNSNHIEYFDFDINKPNLETDLNEDLFSLLTYIESDDSNQMDVNRFKRDLQTATKRFREEIHRAELLLILAAYRREDGFPMLDMFNKVEVDASDKSYPKLYTVPRNRSEFFKQIVGDGSFLSSYYKVL